MKKIIILFMMLCAYTSIVAQCNYKTPSMPIKLSYGCREVTISELTINGKSESVAFVSPGQTIKVSLHLAAKRGCDYCPSCVVQVYWGIHNYHSVCGVSFYGYTARTKSSDTFKAPSKAGVYYLTMGGTLDYSCVNNLQRPPCDPNMAFAVLVVGTPDPEKIVTLDGFSGESSAVLRTSAQKHGCFGEMSLANWYRNDKLLADATSPMLEVTESGLYKVVWKNCTGDSAIAEKFIEIREKVIPRPPKEEKEEEKPSQLAKKLGNTDKLILENLNFEIGKAILLPSSKDELNQLAKILHDNPTMEILLEGHTDRIGDPRQNKKLSEDRVKNTKQYLMDQGIYGGRMQTKGWGDTKPLTTSKDENERKRNRRVEITVLRR